MLCISSYLHLRYYCTYRIVMRIVIFLWPTYFIYFTYYFYISTLRHKSSIKLDTSVRYSNIRTQRSCTVVYTTQISFGASQSLPRIRYTQNGINIFTRICYLNLSNPLAMRLLFFVSLYICFTFASLFTCLHFRRKYRKVSSIHFWYFVTPVLLLLNYIHISPFAVYSRMIEALNSARKETLDVSKFDEFRDCARLSALTFCKQPRERRFSRYRGTPDRFLIDSLAVWSRDSSTCQLICNRKRKIK